MAGDIGVKMSVSGATEFKRSMTEASSSVKTLEAQLKLNEKQFKATGDAEKYLQDKSKLLKQQITEQNRVIKEGQSALKAMKERGVDEASKSYQDMQRKVYEAQAQLIDMQATLQDVENGFTGAAGSAEKLTDSINGIGKKLSLDQVISGINTITGTMETAGKAAVDLGAKIWENITDAARFADDTATQAGILGMSIEDYQAYKKVFDTTAEITVQEWQKAKMKVQKAINDPTQEQTDILALLGIQTHKVEYGKNGEIQGAARGFEEVFWEIGEALRQKVASGEMTQDLADTYANALFGRGFAGLNNIFDLGQEGFEKAVEEQTVASEEAIKKNAELNDKLIKLQGDFESLEQEVMSGLTPALTTAVETLDSLLNRVTEYLKTPEGKEALEAMETAVSGLFEDLGKIDPEEVVEGFVGVFDTVIGSLEWLVEHKDEVGGALGAIVGTWGALKLTGGALEVYGLIKGLQGLTGGAAAAGQAGSAAGAAWGAGFATAVAEAAPWLIGLYTLLNPADTKDNSLADSNGNMTAEGWSSFFEDRERMQRGEYKDNNWNDWINWAGEFADSAADLWNDVNGIRALARYAGSGQTETDLEKLKGELQTLGYVLREAEEVAQIDTHKETSANGTEIIYNENGENIGAVIPKARGFVGQKRQGEGRIIEDEKGILDLLGASSFGEDVEMTVEPTLADDAAQSLQEEADQITVDVVTNMIPDWSQITDGSAGGHGFGEPGSGGGHGFANGLWSVPWDGYPAILHKGERVVPAREVAASRNFSSNLYVESMYMNNGTDADGLAAAMAAAQRRTMNGFGS